MNEVTAAAAAAKTPVKRQRVRKPAAAVPAADPVVTDKALREALASFQDVVSSALATHGKRVDDVISLERVARGASHKELTEKFEALQGQVAQMPERIRAAISANLEQEVLAIVSKHAGKITRMGVKQSTTAFFMLPYTCVIKPIVGFVHKPAPAASAVQA